MNVSDQLTSMEMTRCVSAFSFARHNTQVSVIRVQTDLVRELENIFYLGLNGFIYEECYPYKCSQKKESS